MQPPEHAIRALRALGQETRYKMLKLLCSRSLTVDELCRALQVSQPAISQHLKVLKDAGLVRIRRKGRTSMCHVDRSLLMGLVDHLREMFDCRVPDESPG
ncbi:MAG: ArsR/SmtB family transcription factor [Bacillota bacterium]